MVSSARPTLLQKKSELSIEQLLAAIRKSARADPTLARIKIQALGNRGKISRDHGDSIHGVLDKVFDENKTSNGLVVIKAVNNLAKNNPRLFTREQLQQWVSKSLEIIDDCFSAGDQKSAALTLINDCWDVLETEQKEWVLGQCINTVRLRSCKSSRESILPQLCGAALDLLTNFLPEDHSEREGTANRAIAIAILNKGGFNIERVAAAKFVTNYIISSHADALIKSSALEGLVSRLNQSENYCEAVAAIFDAGLESVTGVAGVTISPPSLMPSRTNGYCTRTWPVRAARPAPPATIPAALERAALERPAR